MLKIVGEELKVDRGINDVTVWRVHWMTVVSDLFDAALKSYPAQIWLVVKRAASCDGRTDTHDAAGVTQCKMLGTVADAGH